MWMLGITIAVIAYALLETNTLHYSVSLFVFNGIDLRLGLLFDHLTKIMMIFILVIGSVIYHYAQNYLESDITRIRFLSQFNLVLVSVLLLVLSENLLTAFVAWQLIGINLYILLNHYHYDPAANRAAKKKFVISRIGDCCFLLAIVLAYHTQNNTLFSTLANSSSVGVICGLLFISVMTKCAQFPFHIWLIDTMETPTPVSALMHAGIINAGGILLTRISAALVQHIDLIYFILAVGLLSAGLSIIWMNQQPDTKKKLAYSTMGQMGYMLTQCSLGAFPAAIFHLISHGFYKASLFLNAGETLAEQANKPTAAYNPIDLIRSSIIAVVVIYVAAHIFVHGHAYIPALMYGFIFMTITTLLMELSFKNITIYSINCAIILAIVAAYLFIFDKFTYLLQEYDYHDIIPNIVQYIIFALIMAVQFYLWLTSKPLAFLSYKDNTEKLMRTYLLNPLRALGDRFNHLRQHKYTYIILLATLLFTGLCFIHRLSHLSTNIIVDGIGPKILVFIFLLTAMLCLIIANRRLKIRSQILFLILFEVAFANVALFESDRHIVAIGLFHIINISLVLLMLYMLTLDKPKNAITFIQTNRLPTRTFYLVISLLLLIGIPGTASFISEFYLLNQLLNSNLWFVIMYLAVIILLSIVVMHSLQVYAFGKDQDRLLTKPISQGSHIVFLTIIGINVFSGISPSILLHFI